LPLLIDAIVIAERDYALFHIIIDADMLPCRHVTVRMYAATLRRLDVYVADYFCCYYFCLYAMPFHYCFAAMPLCRLC